MEDIEVVIKIPKILYDQIQSDAEIMIYSGMRSWKGILATLLRSVRNGTPLPKGHGRLIDADKVENITWQEPYYHDALNVLSEVRDKVRELPTIIEADKEERK